MKIVSIMLNILLVGLVIFEIVEDGLPGTSDDSFWLFIMVFVTPLVTLYYLLFTSKRESWLGLYFRRKAAEEKQKLKQFEDREHKENLTMPNKPLLSEAELLGRINSELANRWPYPDRSCRVESLKKSSQIGSNWAADTDSTSGADLSHLPECDSVRKAVVEELAAKYNVRWP